MYRVSNMNSNYCHVLHYYFLTLLFPSLANHQFITTNILPNIEMTFFMILNDNHLESTFVRNVQIYRNDSKPIDMVFIKHLKAP